MVGTARQRIFVPRVQRPLHGYSQALYYTKNAAELQEGFLKENVRLQPDSLPADGQKEAFHALIAETLGTECDYSVVKNIHETLNEKLEEYKSEPGASGTGPAGNAASV